MDTKAAVTELKSLKRAFNRRDKIEGSAQDEGHDYVAFNRQLDTVIDAISSDNIGAAKSVLGKLKATFDDNAEWAKGTEQLVLGGEPFSNDRKPQYRAALGDQHRSENYSRKVSSVIAKLQ